MIGLHWFAGAILALVLVAPADTEGWVYASRPSAPPPKESARVLWRLVR